MTETAQRAKTMRKRLNVNAPAAAHHRSEAGRRRKRLNANRPEGYMKQCLLCRPRLTPTARAPRWGDANVTVKIFKELMNDILRVTGGWTRPVEVERKLKRKYRPDEVLVHVRWMVDNRKLRRQGPKRNPDGPTQFVRRPPGVRPGPGSGGRLALFSDRGMKQHLLHHVTLAQRRLVAVQEEMHATVAVHQIARAAVAEFRNVALALATVPRPCPLCRSGSGGKLALFTKRGMKRHLLFHVTRVERRLVAIQEAMPATIAVHQKAKEAVAEFRNVALALAVPPRRRV